jgi:glycosyltransferase involved in cell wall biosynthesis
MKVLLVCPFYPPIIGGSSSFTSGLAEKLAAEGHLVQVLTTSVRGEALVEEFIKNITVFRIRAKIIGSLGNELKFNIPFILSFNNILRIYKIIKKKKPDIISIHGQFYDLTLITSIVAKILRIPIFITIHTRLEGYKNSSKVLFYIIDKVILKLFFRIIKVNFVAMDTLMSHYISTKYGYTQEKISNIGVAINDHWFKSDSFKKEISFLDNVNKNQHIITSIGHIIHLRNRIQLILSLRELLKVRNDFILIVVGKNYLNIFEKFIDTNLPKNNYLYLESLNQTELRRLYSISSLEVHDLQGLGFGTASIEAISQGIPTISTAKEDNFSNTPMLDGIHYFKVDETVEDLATKINYILNMTSDERKTFASTSRNFARTHFTFNVVTAKYVAAFCKLGIKIM